MADDKFDAIVVGAGPAGCACAYVLAREGKNVLLVERGDSAGAKNVSGGRLYIYALEMIEPGMYQRAPLQRKIVREQIMLLGERTATTIDYFDPAFGGKVPQSYSVVRAKLDEWFAGEAEAKGATLAAGVKVDGVIEEGGKIVGIRAGEEEMRCDIVVAADGINSLLAQQAGLFGDVEGHAVGVGVKETIELQDSEISARFAVKDDEGAARVAIGCTDGISGGAFLYTNKGSISLGIVFNPAQAAKQSRHIQDILQDFKMHPAILPLIEGGTTVEYGAHLVPEIGYRGIPEKLHREGMVVIGDAARFGINTGLIIRGMDLAMVSGLAAAQAILGAKDTCQVGPLYMKKLEELFLLGEERAYQNFHKVFEIPRVFREVPKLANEAMQFLFTVDGKIPTPMVHGLMGVVHRNVSFGQMLADSWKVYRSI
jgi:electron transfer flavoprotein-quinone oxidoreductase